MEYAVAVRTELPQVNVVASRPSAKLSPAHTVKAHTGIPAAHLGSAGRCKRYIGICWSRVKAGRRAISTSEGILDHSATRY